MARRWWHFCREGDDVGALSFFFFFVARVALFFCCARQPSWRKTVVFYSRSQARTKTSGGMAKKACSGWRSSSTTNETGSFRQWAAVGVLAKHGRQNRYCLSAAAKRHYSLGAITPQCGGVYCLWCAREKRARGALLSRICLFYSSFFSPSIVMVVASIICHSSPSFISLGAWRRIVARALSLFYTVWRVRVRMAWRARVVRGGRARLCSSPFLLYLWPIHRLRCRHDMPRVSLCLSGASSRLILFALLHDRHCRDGRHISSSFHCGQEGHVRARAPCAREKRRVT